jgi:hypothetical protein
MTWSKEQVGEGYTCQRAAGILAEQGLTNSGRFLPAQEGVRVTLDGFVAF